MVPFWDLIICGSNKNIRKLDTEPTKKDTSILNLIESHCQL